MYPNSKLKRLKAVWRKANQFSPFGSVLALTTVTNIGMAVLGMTTGVFTARLLGPEGRGELAAIQLYPTFLSLIAALGLPESVVYFSAREPEKAGTWLATALSLALGVNAIFLAIGYIAIPYLLKAQKIEIIQCSQIFLLYLPISILFGMTIYLFRGRNQLVIWNFIRIWPVVLWVFILMGGKIFNKITPVNFSNGYLIGFSVLWLIPYFFIKRDKSINLIPDTRLVKPLLKYGLPTVFSSVPSVVNLRVDQLLIAGTLGAKTLGYYVVGVAWAGISAPILGALSSILLPRVASAKIEDQRGLIAQGIRTGVILAVIFCSIGFVLAPFIIPVLFGTEFKAAVLAAQVLSVASVFMFINQVFSAGNLSIGKPVLVFLSEGIGAVVTILSLVILLKPLGIIGAALASLFSYISVSITQTLFFRYRLHLGFREMFLPRFSDYQILYRK